MSTRVVIAEDEAIIRLDLKETLEEEGYEVVVYHSHPASPAEPSQTDINLAAYPDWRYVIVSATHEPTVRCWRIDDGRVEEEDVTVDG